VCRVGLDVVGYRTVGEAWLGVGRVEGRNRGGSRLVQAGAGQCSSAAEVTWVGGW